jgi:hypothetical protein
MMRRFTLIHVLVVVLLGAGVFSAGCDSRESAVRAADEAHDRALDTKDGPAAVAMLSKDSIAMYDRLIELARTGSKSKVQKLTIPEQLEILQMRLIFDADELKKATGSDYYATSVKIGWRKSASNFDREKVSLFKDRAVVNYWNPVYHRGGAFHFVLEDGKWKDDKPGAMADVDAAIKTFARENKMTDEQIIMHHLEEITGEEELPDSIWSPPR